MAFEDEFSVFDSAKNNGRSYSLFKRELASRASTSLYFRVCSFSQIKMIWSERPFRLKIRSAFRKTSYCLFMSILFILSFLFTVRAVIEASIFFEQHFARPLNQSGF